MSVYVDKMRAGFGRMVMCHTLLNGAQEISRERLVEILEKQ
jgi:hypothetical protein